MTRRLSLFLPALLLTATAGGATAHLCHRSLDKIRHEVRVELDMTWVPNGTALRIASLGFHELLADWLWMRAVLLFGQRWGSDPPEQWTPWFLCMLKAISELDPSWENPYTYGGMMLRVMGQADASDHVFTLAMKNIPSNPFFPFAMGMNQYLLRNDAEGAARWIRRASAMPGAPPWYSAAAAGFLARQDQRGTAIRFLEEEQRNTGNPQIQAVLQDKLANLRHDERADELETRRRQFQEATGRDIRSLQELDRPRGSIPPDPLGGHWILAPDGVIRSDVREEFERGKLQSYERSMLARK